MKTYNSELDGVCIITLSDNYDHQEVAFSMFNELYKDYNVYNIGLTNQKNPRSPKTERSFYFDAPRRPGITKGTFNFKVLKQIVKKINSLNVKYVYFESEHLWNAFIMKKINKRIKKVVVIHDVIPHSDSKGKKLANKVCCKLADLVVIRNEKYKVDLIRLYNVLESKIIVFPLWRYYPSLSINKDVNGFLFFGRIRKYKGIVEMISIAKKCPDRKFYVIGSSDGECEGYVEELKKYQNVEVIDKEVNDNEMKYYFDRVKAVILPYESATQSGVIVDSYKYSRPVIAYDVGAISEQVLNNESGFLIPPHDTEKFVSFINKFDEISIEEIVNYQRKAYNFGLYKYSVQEAKKRFIELFLSD